METTINKVLDVEMQVGVSAKAVYCDGETTIEHCYIEIGDQRFDLDLLVSQKIVTQAMKSIIEDVAFDACERELHSSAADLDDRRADEMRERELEARNE